MKPCFQHPTVLNNESVHQIIRDGNIAQDTGRIKSMAAVIATKRQTEFVPRKCVQQRNGDSSDA